MQNLKLLLFISSSFLYVKATFATVSLESQLGKLRNRWTNKTASSLRLSDFRRYKSNKYILGKGAYGVVELVLATKYPYRSAKVAMKVIKMPQEGQSNNSRLSILAEISILTKIKSRYTVNMFAFDWDNSNVYIMLSYAAGGSFNDLYQYVKSTSLKKALEEGDVKLYLAQIIMGVAYLHSRNIVHRDLKPHNVLVTSDGHLQLADFGMSRILKNGDEKGNIRCGTPRYTAPEAIGYDKRKKKFVFLHKKGLPKAMDWYAIGIIAYELLYGSAPYRSNGNDAQSRFIAIIAANLVFPTNLNVSSEAKDFIRQLLTKNVRMRLGSNYGAEEVMLHPFFEGIVWSRLHLTKMRYKPMLSTNKQKEFKKKSVTKKPKDDSGK